MLPKFCIEYADPEPDDHDGEPDKDYVEAGQPDDWGDEDDE